MRNSSTGKVYFVQLKKDRISIDSIIFLLGWVHIAIRLLKKIRPIPHMFRLASRFRVLRPVSTPVECGS